MITLIFTLGAISPVISLCLFFLIANWRESRDRAVYLKRIGHTRF